MSAEKGISSTSLKIKLMAVSFILIVIANYIVSFQPNSFLDESILIILLAITCILYVLVNKTFLQPLRQIAVAARSMAAGDFQTRVHCKGDREINDLILSLNELAENAENATTLVKNIKEGKLDGIIEKEKNIQQLKRDGLSDILIDLRDHMKIIADQEKQRNWATEGLAKFVYILRANNEEISTLCDKIISNLVKYIDANQGGLFVVNNEDEDENNQYLELVSCYAFDRKKYLNKKIQPGEGLVGQAYLEKDTIYLTEVPHNYINITSGLGLANPKSILIVPLKVNEQIFGIVELASFHPFKKYQIDFLEKLGESIASTISNAKVNERTKSLLQASQEQSEEMRAQEEEMRQNMEELHATQEDLQRKNVERQQAEAELIRSRNYLHSIINKIGNPILVKDRKHRLILINDAFCSFVGMKREDMINKSDHDLFPKEQADIFYEKDEVVFNSGKENVNVETNTDSNGVSRTVITKKAVFTDEKGETFLVGTVIDLSNTSKYTEGSLL